MDENALGFTSYWRNSLADAESGKGSFERKDAKNFTHWHGIAAGRLEEAIVSKFFKEKKTMSKRSMSSCAQKFISGYCSMVRTVLQVRLILLPR